MIPPALGRYLSLWSAKSDGALIETPSSWLLPVRVDGARAMLKVYRPGSDERAGAALLDYYGGNGAVPVLAADEGALLMERAAGTRSLMAIALSGGDLDAAEILAVAVAKLHAPRPRPVPAGLTPLADWFAALHANAGNDPRLARASAVARRLLADPRDVVALHGDLHHDNVLDFGARGWLAIDPKALLGERTYDVANLLGNPWPHGAIVHSTARMRRLAELYAARLGLDFDRVVAFAYAHAGLSASWAMDDRGKPAYRLKCMDVLEPLVQ